MTLVKTIRLKCDGGQPDCEANYFANADMNIKTVKELRKLAQADGWLNRGGIDLCKSCAMAGC